MKKIMFLTLLLVVTAANAGPVLEKLKNTPATQYQVGIFQLEWLTFILKHQMKDEYAKGSSFKFSDVGIDKNEGSIYLRLSFIGNTKDVTNEQCSVIKEDYSRSFNLNELSNKIWPGLTEDDYKALESEFSMKMELISRDNKNFSVSC